MQNTEGKATDYDILFRDMADRRYREMADEALRKKAERMYEKMLDRQLYGSDEREEFFV